MRHRKRHHTRDERGRAHVHLQLDQELLDIIVLDVNRLPPCPQSEFAAQCAQ